MLSGEPRSGTMAVTEQERSYAFSAGTWQVRIARLFHMAAAPTDEPTIGFWIHFEKAVLFDAIAAAHGLLHFPRRSSQTQGHRKSSLLSRALPAADLCLMRLAVNSSYFCHHC